LEPARPLVRWSFGLLAHRPAEAKRDLRVDVVFFDFGGVILRTEYQAPREHLAERLNISYEELADIVFDSESARRASIGQITAVQHWEAVASRLGVSDSEIPGLQKEFFGGDVLDRDLLRFIRSLRPERRTGLISNGWPDLRNYMISNRCEDAFDSVVISAELGILKPDPRIYEAALSGVGLPPEAAVLVDDFPENVDAAVKFGMAGVLFRNPAQMKREVTALLK
jgi:FMN phosphatase YigB (HAD superfamily)